MTAVTSFIGILDEIKAVRISGANLSEEAEEFQALTPEQEQMLLGRIAAERADAERRGAFMDATYGTLEVLLQIAKVVT